MKYVTSVWLEEDSTGGATENYCAAFVADSVESGGKLGKSYLLLISDEFRDREEYPNDDEWIETCLSESWRTVTVPLAEGFK